MNSYNRLKLPWKVVLTGKPQKPYTLPLHKADFNHITDLVSVEHWSDVTINAEIPNEKFAWLPPVGWQQWQEPILTDDLIKPGATAPDFELKLAKGGKVKLSDYKGKIVWLYIWRAG